jgi:hypothetical protein
VPLGLLVDLAKLHEHHARDLEAALVVARSALARAEADGPAAWRPGVIEALRHRVRRLERRVGHVSAGRDSRLPDGGPARTILSGTSP